MEHYLRIKQSAIKFWFELRHVGVAFLVLINGLLIFKTIYGMSTDLTSLFHINSFSGLDWNELANGPWFMLGAFLMLNSAGLFFRAKLAWAVSIVLLIITLIFTFHFHPNQHFSIYLCFISLTALMFFGKDFDRSSATAGGIFSAISFTVLLFYATYGALYFGEGFNPKINSLMTAFYFSIVTMTTVGYGDVIPISEPARLFTTSIIIAGITVFATSVTTVFGPIISGGLNKLVKGHQHQMNRKNHYIICGTSILAMNTVTQLSQRGMDLTIITSRNQEDEAEIEQKLGKKFDILFGDVSDNCVLELAGIQNCKAILALTNDDAQNVFVVMSAKDQCPQVKTVIAVNDSKNINKVKQVKPDVVLSPQLFGSEVLASVLNGEPLDNNRLLDILTHSGEGLLK